MNTRSIAFKLITGGIMAVVIPLAIVGTISYIGSSRALSELAEARAVKTAEDLARQVRTRLSTERKLAALIAADTGIARALSASAGSETGSPAPGADLENLLDNKLELLDERHQGIMLSDAHGRTVATRLRPGKATPESAILPSVRSHAMQDTAGSGPVALFRAEKSAPPSARISTPVTSTDGTPMGMISLVIELSAVTGPVLQTAIGRTGYGFMADEKGLITAHPKEREILTLNIRTLDGMEAFAREMLSGKTGVERYAFRGTDKIAGYAPVTGTDWYVCVTQDSEEFLASTVSMRNQTLAVGLLSVGITLAALLLFARRITGPINTVVNGLKDIARGDGDLTLRLSVNSRDEIGELARWFNQFVEKMQDLIREIAGGVETLGTSSGTLSGISGEMARGASDTSEKSHAVSAAAEEMNVSMNSIAAGSEQASVNVNMVAAAAEEMTATVGEISMNCTRAGEVTSDAVAKAGAVSRRVDDLGHEVEGIGKVTEVINDISEQTNLLALNATIEASRAGAAGRGFAVVAGEIKELARQTAAATQEIKGKIEGIQRSTAGAVSEIGEISGVIHDVNDMVGTIAAAVEEQTVTTREIAGNVSQASEGIREISENISQNSMVSAEIARDIADVDQSAREMADGSAKVNGSAEDLSGLSDRLRGMVGQFRLE